MGPPWRLEKNSLGEVGSVDKFKISGGNWGLEIWLYLMTPCWQNKHGDYKKNTKLSFLQGFQGKIFPQLLNHGGEGFKIGFLCLEKYFAG